jgi:hypothetical protein
MQAASGITFEVEVDWMVLAPIAEERGYKDRCGEIVYDWYVKNRFGGMVVVVAFSGYFPSYQLSPTPSSTLGKHIETSCGLRRSHFSV